MVSNPSLYFDNLSMSNLAIYFLSFFALLFSSSTLCPCLTKSTKKLLCLTKN